MDISISFISGCMLGVEVMSDEHGYVAVVDLFFIRVLIEW